LVLLQEACKTFVTKTLLVYIFSLCTLCRMMYCIHAMIWWCQAESESLGQETVYSPSLTLM